MCPSRYDHPDADTCPRRLVLVEPVTVSTTGRECASQETGAGQDLGPSSVAIAKEIASSSPGKRALTSARRSSESRNLPAVRVRMRPAWRRTVR